MNRSSFIALCAGASALALTLSTSLAKDFPKGSPKFEDKYKKAVAEAKKAGKPIVVVFSASWCPPCQAMKKDVYPSDAVKAYHDKFVWAYVDVDENDKANKKAAQDFGVSGIPHVEFLKSDGTEVDKQVGGISADAFVKKLDATLAAAGGTASGTGTDATKPAAKPETKPAAKPETKPADTAKKPS